MSAEAKDAGGLSPAKDANEGWRKSGRKDCRILMGDQYQMIEYKKEETGYDGEWRRYL